MKKYYVKYWDRVDRVFKTEKFAYDYQLENWLSATYPRGLSVDNAQYARPTIVHGEEINPTIISPAIKYKVR